MTNDIKPAFNLLDEPWIPVRTPGGEVCEVSLTDVLLHAGGYAALAETSPPNLIALYRLLLTMVHRALTTHHGPWKDADRARWFREGLPEAPIKAYLEQWRERFWLFHPQYPFMQVAALAEAEETRDEKSWKPWAKLTLDCASGNAPVVFDHRIDDEPEPISASTAIRHLLGYLQFVPGGMIRRFRFRDESGPLDGVAAVLPVGQTLNTTLCLSLHPFSRCVLEDLPPWEVEPPPIQHLSETRATLPMGEIDLYTRLTRSVLFVRETAESDAIALVHKVHFGAGLTIIAHDSTFPDPMAGYRKRGEDKIAPVTFQEGRALWRDLPALLPSGAQDFIAPPVIGYALNCMVCLSSNEPLNIVVAGTASDPVKEKIFRWRIEKIEFPRALFTNPDAVAELRDQIRLVENTYMGKERLSSVLAKFIRLTLPDPDSADTHERARAIRSRGPASAAFFSTVERALPRLMQQIATGDIDAARHDWLAVLKDAAEQAWEATRRSLGESPAVMRAEARAHPKFRGLLRSLERPETASTHEEAIA